MTIRHLTKITIIMTTLLCSPILWAAVEGEDSKPDSTVCTHGIPTSCLLDDDAISTGVEAQLGQDQLLRGLTITVSSDAGIVTLDGNVRNQTQMDEAINIAKTVSGVKEVHSNINITDGKNDY